MDFEQIMRNITGGLTGDAKQDVVYLKKQMETYKNHEMSTEILRACGRLMYSLLSDEDKEKLGQAISNDMAGTEAVLDEVRFNIFKKNYSKAEELIETLIDKTEKLPMFQNDQVSEYFTFSEAFEEILYVHLHKPKKKVRRAEVPYADIYLQYGSLLFDLKRYPEANAALEKAMRWNPTKAKIAFEYAETYKAMGDMEKFAELTRNTFKHAFRESDLARCYRNMGYYLVEKEAYQAAIGCYLLSMQYDKDSKNAQSELYYIQTKTEGNVNQPTLEELERYAEQYDFPMRADDDIVGLAYSYGKYDLDRGNIDFARYFFDIVYELTGADEIKEILDSLTQEKE